MPETVSEISSYPRDVENNTNPLGRYATNKLRLKFKSGIFTYFFFHHLNYFIPKSGMQ
jgi:hypothetical protein